MPDKEICVAVFAKPPRPGEAKTRLGRALGDDVSARLAAAFLQDTWSALSQIPWARPVLATPEPDADHGVDAPKWDQGGGDLGARIQRVVARGLLNHSGVIALGADAPGTPRPHLEAVGEALATADAALGPSADGGFWALGLTRCPAELLVGLPWSAADTCSATARRLRDQGLSVAAAPAWFDVDEVAELRRWRNLVARQDAPRTHAVLDELGWPELG